MLRNYQPSPKNYDNYLQDSDLTPITTEHSIFNNFSQGIGQNVLMGEEIASAFSGVPMVDNGLKDTQEMFERENNSPQQGVGQVVGNTLSNMIGSSLATGYVGSVASRGMGMVFGQVAKKVLPTAFETLAKKPLTRILGEDLEQYLPKVATEEGKRTMNVAEYGKHLTSAYGAGAGFVLPQAVTENYNADQNTLHWGGIAKETLIYGGGVGLALDVFPYAAGVIWGKTKGLLGDVEKMPMPGSLSKFVPPEVLSGEESGAQHHPTLDKLWTAHQNGRISLDEYKWMRNYLVNPSNLEEMKQSAVSILMKDGHPVDAGQMNVMLQLMKPEDATSFLTAVSDQLGSAVDKQADSAMSDYVVNNGLDRLQSDPKLLNGLQGFYEFISNKLEKKPETLERFERAREEGHEHINNTHPFSQKMMYTANKNGAKQVPHTVPKNVARRLKQEEKIKDLEEKKKKHIADTMPQELADAKTQAEKDITKADKERTKAQGKLDRGVENLGKHEEKITELEEKLKSETNERKIKTLNEKLEAAKAKRDEFAAENKKLAQSVKFSETARKNAIAKMKHIETKMREHAKPGTIEKIKKIEQKLDEIRNKLAPILHPDDELRAIEKELITDDGLPKNFRSTEAYQRLHDLAQVSDRAKMLLHHVELLREYEKQEGYKNIADMLLQMSQKGFRKVADADRVVSYLKDRVEQSSGLKESVEVKSEPLKEQTVPQDAEKVLEEQGREQKTESEEHKDAYNEAKARFDEFKKSENIFKNFIQCVMGSANV